MNAITHVLGDGNFCCLCGERIPLDEVKRREWKPGYRIGLLTSPAANPVSYWTGDHDTNRLCNSPTVTAE